MGNASQKKLTDSIAVTIMNLKSLEKSVEEPPLTPAPRSPKKLLLVPHVPCQSDNLYEAPWVHAAISQGLERPLKSQNSALTSRNLNSGYGYSTNYGITVTTLLNTFKGLTW